MSIFGNILNKLGLKKDAPAAKAAPAAPAAKAPVAKTPTMKGVPTAKPGMAAKPGVVAKAPQAERAIPVVDVVAQLEQLAAKSGRQLNWKVSIVDLLTLLGIDSGLEARKELAIELGCPADAMNDSARMNVWLHKTVLQKIAENGGNIPRELLD